MMKRVFHVSLSPTITNNSCSFKDFATQLIDYGGDRADQYMCDLLNMSVDFVILDKNGQKKYFWTETYYADDDYTENYTCMDSDIIQLVDDYLQIPMEKRMKFLLMMKSIVKLVQEV